MKKIIVGTKNPIKIEAVKQAFEKMLPNESFVITGVQVASGVADQPLTNEETLTGAKNRAFSCKEEMKNADYWIGIEGGIEFEGEETIAFAWIFITSKTLQGKAKSGSFYLPPVIAQLIRSGKELGEADDIVFGQKNSKQKSGAVGLLTGNVSSRGKLYEEAVILALIPFRNVALYGTD